MGSGAAEAETDQSEDAATREIMKMTDKMIDNLRSLTSSVLAQQVADAAIARGAALENANPRLANKQSDKIDDACRVLRSRGDEGQTALITLLKSAPPWSNVPQLRIFLSLLRRLPSRF
jgi:hypothetical protein